MKRIFLIGYMGSGKTTIGKRVAKRLNMNFVDMDTHIEGKKHKTISQIFNEMSEERFRELERECLLEVSDYKNAIISTGGGAPCFFDNMEVMNSRGITIYINLTPGEIAARLKTTNLNERPVLAKLQENELEVFIATALEKRETFYNRATLKVSGTDKEIEEKIISYILQQKSES